ncbi:alpha/beta fold hydrolase [Thalassococcus sp. S3]|uniref:alpha/beta fold hydrolase n=1 Tax=Thalassococcus sp. S3 TaxID=2017482 RepID=UPI001C2CC33C|nr:alpha/beta hydrolase [Thalassococcus sp. S3]
MPLIALHGIGSSGAGFAAFAIASARRVLAWDMPGYGQSDDADIGDLDAVAQALLHAAPETFDLLGHSLGCLIAGRVALLAPLRVRRLTFASPALGHGVALPDLSPATKDRMGVTDMAAFAAARAPRLLARPEGAALAQVTAQMAALRAPGHEAAARILSSGDLLADARRLTLPADVIVGAADVITPPGAARRLYAALPLKGAFTEVPEAGHALTVEAPEALATAMMETT